MAVLQPRTHTHISDLNSALDHYHRNLGCSICCDLKGAMQHTAAFVIVCSALNVKGGKPSLSLFLFLFSTGNGKEKAR